MRFFIAIVLGGLAGMTRFPFILTCADCVSSIFMRSLKFISLPLIFLSILATISGFQEKEKVFHLGSKTVKKTLLTTVLSATVALIFFEIIHPVSVQKTAHVSVKATSYLEEFIKIFPDNILRPFLDGHVVGIVIIAFLLGLVTLSLEEKHRATLHHAFQSFFVLFMTLTQWIVKVMPLAIFAFVTLFIAQPHESSKDFALYLSVILLSNGVHALVVLPTLLKMQGISPFKTAKGMFSALSVAFFSKSSAAAMPLAIECAEKNLKVSPQVSRFTFPLCTTINMNACAAFILITVFFVAQSYGMVFTWVDKIVWIGVATLAAVGNAGVPMGCYFLTSALLSGLDVPLELMGAILPFYALIDMFETAVNIWSDSCVTVSIDHELKQSEGAS